MSVKKLGKAELGPFFPPFYFVGESIGGLLNVDLDFISNFSGCEILKEKAPYNITYKERLSNVKNHIAETIKAEMHNHPIRLKNVGDSRYCVYKGIVYKFDRAGYSEEEMLLQIMDLEDDERRKFERLKHKFSQAEKIEKQGNRETIPEEVRIAVWRRDSGKCSNCGSRENLEYDHIIPVSRGGNNTVRNIELLCEKCNRSKSDEIC